MHLTSSWSLLSINYKNYGMTPFVFAINYKNYGMTPFVFDLFLDPFLTPFFR